MNGRLLHLMAPASSPPYWLAYLAAASCAHLALAFAFASEPEVALTIPATEVELEPIAPPKPPEPPPPLEPPPTAAAPPAPAKARARRAPEPPTAAHAGKLLTAHETPEPADEQPFRFVSDPNGRSFGTGIVARGGTASHGEGSAIAAKPEPSAVRSEHITPADQLQRQPTLQGDGCRGFFPDHAHTDLGAVSLIATVQANGALSKLQIETETPTGEGFANAARACLTSRRFAPALDRSGEPTTARTRINLRFTR